MIGSLLFGVMADGLGRLHALVAANITALLGNLMTSFSMDAITFSISRFLAGAATDANFVMMYIIGNKTYNNYKGLPKISRNKCFLCAIFSDGIHEPKNENPRFKSDHWSVLLFGICRGSVDGCLPGGVEMVSSVFYHTPRPGAFLLLSSTRERTVAY